jgi:hypothetical protein
MLKRLFSFKGYRTTPSFLLLLMGLILTFSPAVRADTISPQLTGQTSTMTYFDSSPPVSDADSELSQAPSQVDPLDSPHPIPWNWIENTQTEFSDKGRSGLRYYRSPSLISPDGQYAVYTRIQMLAEPEMYRSQVSSVMFLENLQTGKLQVIRGNSPLTVPQIQGKEIEQLPGLMSILIPVSWSKNGDRLLCRQFEGFFNTSDASDYAVIWDRQTNETTTISPNTDEETTAILLGWDNQDSNQVLFRAGILGEENWGIWAVALDGQTFLASNDSPMTYGKMVTNSWTGMQALR